MPVYRGPYCIPIGLRMALGATRSSVFRMIFRQSIVIVALGPEIGLAFALLAAQAVGNFVVVNVWDTATCALVGAVLVFVALGSCYLPQRRAMIVELLVALRED